MGDKNEDPTGVIDDELPEDEGEKDDRPEEANGTVIQSRGKMIGSVPINSHGRVIR